MWFAFDQSRPLAFFAGIWAQWTSVRKLMDGKVTAEFFGFLTTEPNAEVRAVHPKAMPAILTEPHEWETWLSAPWKQAQALQRPLPDGACVDVPRGRLEEDAGRVAQDRPRAREDQDADEDAHDRVRLEPTVFTCRAVDGAGPLLTP